MLMSMSSRDMSGSSAFSTSSCSPVWKMSTGGIQLLGAVNPKSRNGSQRTIVILPSLSLVGLPDQLTYFVSAYSASTTSPSLMFDDGSDVDGCPCGCV